MSEPTRWFIAAVWTLIVVYTLASGFGRVVEAIDRNTAACSGTSDAN